MLLFPLKDVCYGLLELTLWKTNMAAVKSGEN